MTTISVPLNEELTKFIDQMIRHNKAENKAAVVRRALYKYIRTRSYKRFTRSS